MAPKAPRQDRNSTNVDTLIEQEPTSKDCGQGSWKKLICLLVIQFQKLITLLSYQKRGKSMARLPKSMGKITLFGLVF